MKHKKFIGVKTTKIYCLLSCPAKAPLPENIVYFKTPQQAQRSGFRPCKRCFPDFPYGKWIDKGSSVFLKPPQEFNFSQCLKFLARSSKEPCHAVEGDTLFKLLKFDGQPALLKIHSPDNKYLCIDFLTPRPKKSIRARAAKYVWDWFDLETDLKPFYRMAKKDPVLKNIAEDQFGLRLIMIGDLFEALCWAMIGQQINLALMYGAGAKKLQEMLENIKLSDGDKISIGEIWTINPMPSGGFSKEGLDSVDMAEAEQVAGPNGETLREMIKNTYHCESRDEEDYYLRRYMAS